MFDLAGHGPKKGGSSSTTSAGWSVRTLAVAEAAETAELKMPRSKGLQSRLYGLCLPFIDPVDGVSSSESRASAPAELIGAGNRVAARRAAQRAPWTSVFFSRIESFMALCVHL